MLIDLTSKFYCKTEDLLTLYKTEPNWGFICVTTIEFKYMHKQIKTTKLQLKQIIYYNEIKK